MELERADGELIRAGPGHHVDQRRRLAAELGGVLGDYRGSLGRGTFRKQGMTNFNAAVTKQWRWSGRRERSAQFRAEAFNALNHVNYSAPGVSFSPGADGRNVSSSFGVISGARDPRIGQLALKLIF